MIVTVRLEIYLLFNQAFSLSRVVHILVSVLCASLEVSTWGRQLRRLMTGGKNVPSALSPLRFCKFSGMQGRSSVRPASVCFCRFPYRLLKWYWSVWPVTVHRQWPVVQMRVIGLSACLQNVPPLLSLLTFLLASYPHPWPSLPFEDMRNQRNRQMQSTWGTHHVNACLRAIPQALGIFPLLKHKKCMMFWHFGTSLKATVFFAVVLHYTSTLL